MVEEFDEKKHIRYAVEAAIAQGKADAAMEAFEKVLERHRILERLAAAMAKGESSEVHGLLRELRFQSLENWPERV